MYRLVRLGGLRSQGSLEPRPDLVTVFAPLAGVSSPVAVGAGFLGVLQAFEDLVQVDTLRGGEVGPSFGDLLAPDSPFSTSSLGGGERGEGRTAGSGLDGLAGDLGVVVVLPLGSVFNPGLGCEEESD